MRSYLRTGRRTAISFGCGGFAVFGFLIVAVLAVAIAVGWGIAVVVTLWVAMWFFGWVMPQAFYRSFYSAYDESVVAGAWAVAMYFLVVASVLIVTSILL